MSKAMSELADMPNDHNHELEIQRFDVQCSELACVWSLHRHGL